MLSSTRKTIFGIAITAAALLLGAPAIAQELEEQQGLEQEQDYEQQEGVSNEQDLDDDAAVEAGELVQEAATVVQEMQSDAEAAKLLQHAKGLFIVPDYAKGAFIVGGAGGSGVLLAQTDTGWSNPAFYNIGSVSLGAQAGFEAGDIVLVLMSDQALDGFKQNNNFALTADAGLVIVDYSARTGAATGREDVVVWADTEGLLVDASFGVEDVMWDEDENQAIYRERVTPEALLSGDVKADVPIVDVLRNALPG